MSRMIELGPRELNLSVDQWITDSLPPFNNTHTSNASASLLSQQQQQQSHQSKIMNVVVPNVACPPAAPKKIRRKPENKPQSQINKCHNEKRRRELENEYIEQLGEFLQINKRDMTACKPDKAAILSEVVKKFRNLLDQREREKSLIRCNKCSPGCSESCKLHPVQQGEVSSTEPPLPEPSINGHSPEKFAYFEAVQHYIRNIGWALLEINSEGYIEYATENVLDVLDYSRQELSGQSIYSYLHTGDHNKVSPILDKNSLSFEWDQDDGPSFPQTPKRTVRIRWLLKPLEETIEQKQQRSNRYKDLLIISTPFKDEPDESSSVFCLITLPEDDQSIEPTMPPTNEQLTIRVDAEGKIIKLDSSQLRQRFVLSLAKEVGKKLEDLVHPQDHQRLKIHLKEVIHDPTVAQVTNYRIRLAPDCYVLTKVQSKMFRSQVQGEPDFVMAVHEILSDNELMALDSGNFSGGMMSSMQPSMSHSLASLQHQQQKHNQGACGGPVLTSVSGGPPSQISPRNGQNSFLMNDNNSQIHHSTSNDIYFSDTFDFDLPSEIETAWVMNSRPESRSSASVSTPRPSSVTAAFSPASAPMCPSPLTPAYSQPSPASLTNNNNTSMTNNNLTNSGAASGSQNHNGSSGFNSAGSNSSSNFQFSFDDKTDKGQDLQKQQPQEQNCSERLRNLLSKSPSGSVLDQSDQERATNQILKNLLNAEDDKDNTLTHKFNPSSMSNRMPLQRPRSTTSDSKNNSNNNMLLQLLNDKSDDDESSGKQQSELLKRLQNPMKDNDHHKEMNNNADLDNEALKKQLRFQGGPASLENSRKRASDGSDDSSSGTSKRPSKLQEKNKMLASLLAEPSRPLTSPNPQMPPVRQMPDIPTRMKRLEGGLASPLGSQPAIPNQTAPTKSTNNNNNSATKNHNIKSAQQKPRQPAGQLRTVQGVKVGGDNVYLTHINQQMQQHQQIAGSRAALNNMLAMTQAANTSTSASFDGLSFVSSSPSITSAPASSSTIQPTEWDPELNDLLENFMEYDEGNFGDEMSYQQMSATASAQLKQQEELAQINKIQQALMECENEDNFTGSPPAYPIHGMTPPQNRLQQQQQQQQQQQAFNQQPPPGYSQRNVRLPMNVTSNNVVTNSNTATVAQATNSQQPNKQANALMLQRLQLQQQQQRILQQQQKERLLQQQQNQQIVVTAGADQLCLSNQGVQSIDSLLNNTVAPNVTLTSRGPVVPDSQLSPNFSQQSLMQQLSPSQQRGNTPFSPQANQNFQQNPFNTSGGQRLSPQQQQMNQQILNNFQQQGTNSNGNNAAQLSPRQPSFTQQSTNAAQGSPANWNQQSATNIRLNLQQNNPMLNAQLSQQQQQQQQNAFANQRQFSAQRQRSLNSPGTTVSRQNSFSSQDSFPEPPSPSAAQQQQYNTTLFNQQQLRLQRQQSIPQATQHLPGSPRPFGPGLPDGPSGYGINGMNMYNTLGGNDFYSRVNLTGGPNNSLNSSQMVRQGLRAVVSGRTQQANVVNAGNVNNNTNNNIRRNLTSPLDSMGSNGGTLVDTNTNNNNPNNNLMMSQQQQQQQLPGNMMSSATDLDASMRFNFDMPQGTTNVDTKMTASPLATQWSGNSNNSRISLEERAGDQKNSSLLLQKLLSE